MCQTKKVNLLKFLKNGILVFIKPLQKPKKLSTCSLDAAKHNQGISLTLAQKNDFANAQSRLRFRNKHSATLDHMITRSKIILIPTLFCTATYLHAFSTDKEQVMHVTADTASLSQHDHKGTYSGNVTFAQGTTNLLADRALTIANIKNQLTLAIAEGSPGKQAHYWTQTDPNKPPVHAYADTIKYYPLKHIIELTGHARVEQGKNSLSAAKITYDTQEQHVVSESMGKTRTVIILYPEKKDS